MKLYLPRSQLAASVDDPFTHRKHREHRKCKYTALFYECKAKTDRELKDRIYSWTPVKGREDTCVHFTLPIPKDREARLQAFPKGIASLEKCDICRSADQRLLFSSRCYTESTRTETR